MGPEYGKLFGDGNLYARFLGRKTFRCPIRNASGDMVSFDRTPRKGYPQMTTKYFYWDEDFPDVYLYTTPEEAVAKLKYDDELWDSVEGAYISVYEAVPFVGYDSNKHSDRSLFVYVADRNFINEAEILWAPNDVWWEPNRFDSDDFLESTGVIVYRCKKIATYKSERTIRKVK